MKRTDAVAIGLMMLAAACAPGEAKHDTAADMAAIGKVRDGYMTAFKAGNAAATAALYTADGHMMDNEQPTATGPADIETADKAFFATMASQEIVITSEKTDISGDLATDRGTFKLTLTPKGATAPINDQGRYLVALRRQADGSWKLTEDLGNRTAPAAPAPPPAKAPGKKG